jgi:BTB And C-terminal Kelch
LESIQSSKFLSCCQSSLLRLLSLERLTIDSELQLVQATINWAKMQNQGVELDPQSSKKLLGPCLEKLRMLALTPTEFSVHVANSGLFSSEDTLKILIHLTAPNCAMEVPEGICTNTNQRKAFGAAGVPAAKLEMVTNQAAELKLVQPIKREPIICFRGSHPGLEHLNKEMKSPTKFEVVEFKVNKNLFLTGVRIAAQLNIKDTGESYNEYIHVAVREAKDTKKMVAFHTHIAPVTYGPGFFDVKFSKPGALVAGELYLLDVNIKSHGVYLCKQRGHIVFFEDFEFNFSAESERFPFSGFLQSLLVEL